MKYTEVVRAGILIRCLVTAPVLPNPSGALRLTEDRIQFQCHIQTNSLQFINDLSDSTRTHMYTSHHSLA